jgi:predicted RNA-binding Zn ribbon-like protein
VSLNLIRGELALEFVGTLHGGLGGGLDDLRQPADLGAWMRTMKVVDAAPSITADELRHAVELRETVYRVARAMVLDSRPAPADVERLNDVAAGCPPTPSVSRSGRLVRTGDLAAALVAVARDALMLWELPDGAVLKRCDDDTCRRAFVDRSRANRRRWCGMANCGDRSKARAYRSRRRAAVSADEGLDGETVP